MRSPGQAQSNRPKTHQDASDEPRMSVAEAIEKFHEWLMSLPDPRATVMRPPRDKEMPASYSNQPLETINIGALRCREIDEEEELAWSGGGEATESSFLLPERPGSSGRFHALPYRDAEGRVNVHLCKASEKEMARILAEEKEDVPQAVQDELRTCLKHAQAWHKSSGPSWAREEHARGAEWVSSTGQRLKEVYGPGLVPGARVRYYTETSTPDTPDQCPTKCNGMEFTVSSFVDVGVLVYFRDAIGGELLWGMAVDASNLTVIPPPTAAAATTAAPAAAAPAAAPAALPLVPGARVRYYTETSTPDTSTNYNGMAFKIISFDVEGVRIGFHDAIGGARLWAMCAPASVLTVIPPPTGIGAFCPRPMGAAASDVTAQSDLGGESDLDMSTPHATMDVGGSEVPMDLDLTHANVKLLEFGARGDEYPQMSQLPEPLQRKHDKGVIELQRHIIDGEQAKRQRVEQHLLQDAAELEEQARRRDEERTERQRLQQMLQRLSQQFLAHPPPAPQAPLPPAPYLQRKPRSHPWPGPGPRPLERVDFMFHATRWESLKAMRNSTAPKLMPQRCVAHTIDYDGPLSVITAASSGPSDNDFEVIFFHTQDWSKNKTPYPQAYNAKYVPVLAITVDKALRKYDYGVFLLSDVHQTRASTNKRLLKIVIAARGSGPYCQARMFDELAKHGHFDLDAGERVASTTHLGDVGPGHEGNVVKLDGNVTTLDDAVDVLFTLTFNEGSWEMMVPNQHDQDGQYCALDIALALPSSRPCLPLHLFDGGGALPPGVLPDGALPRNNKVRIKPRHTRVWPKKPDKGVNGGIQLAPRGHSTR